MSDKNSMLHWYPLVKNLCIPQPRTEIIPIKSRATFDWGDFIDGKATIEEMEQIKDACNKMGYPVFIRTDQLSGKHDWKNTCYVEKEEDLEPHLRALVEESLTAGIMGLDVNAIVVRDYIKMDNLFTAFRGSMPVNPEIRFFVKDGSIQCWHWYWVEDAIRNPSVENWQDLLAETKDGITEKELTQLHEYAHDVAMKIAKWSDSDQWSVDFCRDAFGKWTLIDMALGKDSWHPDCKFKERDERFNVDS